MGDDKAAETVKVRVVEGVAVFDGEAQRSGGSVLDVPPLLAVHWLAAGWVTKVRERARKRTS